MKLCFVAVDLILVAWICICDVHLHKISTTNGEFFHFLSLLFHMNLYLNYHHEFYLNLSFCTWIYHSNNWSWPTYIWIFLDCVGDLWYCDNVGRHNLVCKVLVVFCMVQFCNLTGHSWYLKTIEQGNVTRQLHSLLVQEVISWIYCLLLLITNTNKIFCTQVNFDQARQRPHYSTCSKMVFTVWQPGLNSASVNGKNHKYLTEIEKQYRKSSPSGKLGKIKD